MPSRLTWTATIAAAALLTAAVLFRHQPGRPWLLELRRRLAAPV